MDESRGEDGDWDPCRWIVGLKHKLQNIDTNFLHIFHQIRSKNSLHQNSLIYGAFETILQTTKLKNKVALEPPMDYFDFSDKC